MYLTRTVDTTMKALVGVIAVALLLALTVAAPSAWAKRMIDAPVDVSDDITRVHVSKFVAGTHEFLEGASMAIVEKNTDTVIDSWVTGKGVHETEKMLDVDKVYVLRELQAPEGYDKIDDIEFIVNATEGTGITLVTPVNDSFELTESYKLSLYDPVKPSAGEQVVTQTRGETRSVAPKTGDETPLALVGALAGVCAAAVVALQFAKRRLS